jgi:hypothetical protein
MSDVRSLVIALLMIFAVVFLMVGLNAPIPHLPWRGLAGRDIPTGILLVFAGLAGVYWELSPASGLSPRMKASSSKSGIADGSTISSHRRLANYTRRPISVDTIAVRVSMRP